MTVEITARHMVGGYAHEHIAEVAWTNTSTGATGHSTRQAMVNWLDDKAKTNVAIVKGPGTKTSWVGTVHPSGRPAYIRSHADGVWNDNLLALPTY